MQDPNYSEGLNICLIAAFAVITLISWPVAVWAHRSKQPRLVSILVWQIAWCLGVLICLLLVPACNGCDTYTAFVLAAIFPLSITVVLTVIYFIDPPRG